MSIDWELVKNIGLPLATLVLGKYLDRWLAKRPRLIVYLGHVSSFTVQGQTPIQVFTHAIVVRNAGRLAANNVRIGHNVLPPHYQLLPSIPHSVVQVPSGGAEILIPKLVPDEQVTISYLYQPPLTWDRVNAYTKSDEGFAKVLNVLPTPQLPKWMIVLLWVLIFIGITSLLYLGIYFIQWFFYGGR